MRRKKTSKKHLASEVEFLKKCRNAVQAAAAKQEAAVTGWMANLSAKVWSSTHDKEVKFNREKHRKKVLAAYKDGLYVPKKVSEQRRLDSSLEEQASREKKARVTYDREIVKRSSD